MQKQLVKYHSLETIPARVFFEVLKTKNYQLLKPKPRTKGLEVVFMAIYDDFFVQSDNKEAKRYLELMKDISLLEYKILTIKQILHFLHYNRTTEKIHLDLIDSLKKHFDIDIDRSTPLASQIIDVLNVQVGIMQTDLDFLKAEFDEMIRKSQSKDFNYYDALVNLSQALPSNSLLREDMTLATYVALEKEAKRLSDKQKTK